jgi:2-C-methyl-D-erythritol 2,4-cyclodiphosphate synthase
LAEPESRVGVAYDAHRLVPGRPLILGGVEVAFERGLDGHSDADIVCHALIDATLGALALGDIGRAFPNTEELRGARSLDLLRQTYERVASLCWQLGNADCMVVLAAPRLAPHVDAMRAALADAMRSQPDRVSVRGTTGDGLGFAGRGEGAAAHAVVLLERS